MAEAITDRYIVAVLRPFVTVAGPLVDSLRESDPFNLRERLGGEHETTETAETAETDERKLRDKVLDLAAGLHMPGTSAWARMDIAERSDWWVGRMGRFVALIAAVPGIGGVLADRLPVTDALGAAGQGLLLCALAGEHGVTDKATRVRLLARVLFERDVDPALAAGEQPGEQETAQELAEELEASRRSKGRVTLKAAASTVWKLGRALFSLSDELERRPRGRFYHRALGMLPVVGMLGDYLGERSGLKRAAKAGTQWLTEHAGQRHPGRELDSGSQA